jgi:hypothetical protein
MDSNDQQQQQSQQNSGTSIQVMPTVLGNGQQIFLQSLSQTLGAGNGQQQSIQVLPIQAIGQGGATTLIMQPQVQPQPQIVQLADGQTFIYQPMIPETAQPQIVNINGNFYQIPAQQPTQATASIQSSPATNTQNQPTQQVVMMTSTQNIPTNKPEPQNPVSVPLNTITINPSADPSPPPSTSTASPVPTVESEEEPLYVNASKSRHSIYLP